MSNANSYLENTLISPWKTWFSESNSKKRRNSKYLIQWGECKSTSPVSKSSLNTHKDIKSFSPTGVELVEYIPYKETKWIKKQEIIQQKRKATERNIFNEIRPKFNNMIFEKIKLMSNQEKDKTENYANQEDSSTLQSIQKKTKKLLPLFQSTIGWFKNVDVDRSTETYEFYNGTLRQSSFYSPLMNSSKLRNSKANHIFK